MCDFPRPVENIDRLTTRVEFEPMTIAFYRADLITTRDHQACPSDKKLVGILSSEFRNHLKNVITAPRIKNTIVFVSLFNLTLLCDKHWILGAFESELSGMPVDLVIAAKHRPSERLVQTMIPQKNNQQTNNVQTNKQTSSVHFLREIANHKALKQVTQGES